MNNMEKFDVNVSVEKSAATNKGKCYFLSKTLKDVFFGSTEE